MDDGERHRQFQSTFGGGFAWQGQSGETIGWIFGEVDGRLGNLQHGHAIGPGIYTGLLTFPTNRWGIMLSGSAYEYLQGDRHTRWRADLAQNWEISRQFSLRFTCSYENAWDDGSLQAVLSMHYFF